MLPSSDRRSAACEFEANEAHVRNSNTASSDFNQQSGKSWRLREMTPEMRDMPHSVEYPMMTELANHRIFSGLVSHVTQIVPECT